MKKNHRSHYLNVNGRYFQIQSGSEEKKERQHQKTQPHYKQAH